VVTTQAIGWLNFDTVQGIPHTDWMIACEGVAGILRCF